MNTKTVLATLIVFFVMLGVPVLAQSEDSDASPRYLIIEPGEAERCNSDFIVDNISDNTADLKVVLGHKVYIDQIMAPHERQAFNLPGTISEARYRGMEDVSWDATAVIINLGPKAHMRVRCIDLKKNPLKGKDRLTVFK